VGQGPKERMKKYKTPLQLPVEEKKNKDVIELLAKLPHRLLFLYLLRID
jgi:hypothetical protein